ncbi:MAG: hypothetical protein R2743_02080 [Ilumatobacteraceae bacterium]
MSAIPERRRRRTISMLVTTLAMLAIAPLLFWVGLSAVLDSTGGRDALADNLPEQTFPITPTALLLTTDDDGVLSSATVFVLAPAGVGGSIVPLPVNADVGFSPDARQSLQQVFADGGADATLVAVESLVLMTINTVATLDPPQLAAALAPFQPYTVTLASDVETGNEQGDQPEVLNEGTVVIDASYASAVLTAGAGQGDETARVANAQGFWTGFATAVGGGRAAAASPDVVPATFDEFMTRLTAGPVASRGLTSIALTGDENPDGGDVVQLDQSEAVFVFASVAPGSMSAPKLGPTFRVEAPPGYDLQVKLTIDKILFVGANVLSVDTTAAARADTVFLVPNEADRTRAQVADEIFGTIEFAEPTVRIDGIDVTLVLGTDYLSSVEI